jgi:glycosyltransferase involved in cell wall biosynthesis
MSPKISVIIPCYNAEMFIENAIISVISQKYSDEIEILVIDDGSTDSSLKILSEMRSKYKQVVILLNERRKGPSGARNTGLSRAEGEYVCFLDADDIWLENHLAEGIGFLDKHNQIDGVFYNFAIHGYPLREKLGDWFSERNFLNLLKVDELDDGYFKIIGNFIDALLNESFMHLQSIIVRKKLLSNIEFNEDVSRSEDRDFCLRLYVKSKISFAFKNIVTGIYFRHDNNLTRDSMDNSIMSLTNHIKLFSNYLSCELENSDYINDISKLLYKQHMELSYCYRQTYNYRLAFTYLLKSTKFGLSVSQAKELIKIITSFSLNLRGA